MKMKNKTLALFLALLVVSLFFSSSSCHQLNFPNGNQETTTGTAPFVGKLWPRKLLFSFSTASLQHKNSQQLISGAKNQPKKAMEQSLRRVPPSRSNPNN